MDFASIIAAIGSVGFPIVMCMIVFMYSQKNDALHDEEIRKLSDAITQNTIAIQQLIQKLEDK